MLHRSSGDVGPLSGGAEVADSGKGANEHPDKNSNLTNVSSGSDAGDKEEVPAPASEQRGNCNLDSSDSEDESGTRKYSYSDVEEPSAMNKYSSAPFYDMERSVNNYSHLRDNNNNPPPLGVCRLYKSEKDRSKIKFFNVPGQGIQNGYTIVPQQVFYAL